MATPRPHANQGHLEQTAAFAARGVPAAPWLVPAVVLCLVGISCSRPLATSIATGGRSGSGGATVSGTGGQIDSGAGTGGSGSGSGIAGSGGSDAAGGALATGGSAATGLDAGGPGSGGAGLGGTTASRDAGFGGAVESSRDAGAEDHPITGLDGGGETHRAGIDGGAKFVGNITTKEKADPAGLVFSDYWDQITPERAGVWGLVQSSPGGSFNWSTLDAIYAYCQDRGIVFKESSFLFGAWQPGQPNGTIAESDVRAWMQAFCARYPKTQVIDVVSEPLHNVPYYADSIGGGTNGDWKWIVNAFAWAREACPDAILVLNDYNTVEDDATSSRIIDIVKIIKAAGAPIQAIGAEAVNADDVATSTVTALLQRLNQETSLPVYITGYRVDRKDDNEQLRIYQSQFPIFWQADYVRGITLSGWIYQDSIRNGWLVRDSTVRPAMTWLMQYLGRTRP